MDSISNIQRDMLARLEQLSAAAQGGVVRPAMAFDSSEVGGVSQAFAHLIKAVDADQHRASDAVRAVELGESEDLVGAMVDSQKASVSFSALLQVRNKLTTAFDEIMRTPL
ncbi:MULTISPECIES: flagellar hook-basal body complex protein FliE [Pseudomonas]|jgi:flagellar hook-basal body complex protein FliE|uniref:Flagellar hook-basal body complex protein FliE n=1 Tax=Serpens gallinarum TaxID=2763075 RepID=A0ABR8TLP8_9PSED|nr:MULTISPECIES: flagellar hook-basal body complex protein FliE [Pseudomonas]MBD7976701.1 flagellar hook-basal body complex protein FliE [Serpens gallinarum]MBF0676857.1 flagellar hook-basal body complex protein FliE [Pseudomonas sp.]